MNTVIRQPLPSPLFMNDAEILGSVGARIQKHRLHSNQTQDDVALHAGVSRSSVRRIEDGEAVSLDIFLRVLRALNLIEAFYEFVPPIEVDMYETLASGDAKHERKRARRGK